MDECKLAWLAGLLDGEGSIGIRIEYKPERKIGKYMLNASVQMSTTDKKTLDATIIVLEELGIRGLGYIYQEKDPTKHLDAWFLRVNRLLDISLLAPHMIPYAVTKKQQWDLMNRYVQSRLQGVMHDDRGRVIRGGNNRKLYSEEEIALVQQLKGLNVRGPAAIRRLQEWQHKLKAVRQ